MRAVVAIASYRRPQGLASLLESLEVSIAAASGAPRPRIVVVDNDPSGSARDVVDAGHGAWEYVHEPEPGIVAARNAGLGALQPDDDAIIFVDDDETVDPGWYQAIIASALRYDADVVTGPVIPTYRDDCPSWIRRGEFFDRLRFPSGTRPRFPATNNALVRRRALALLQEPRFSQQFAVSGGSDSEFFDRLSRAGADIRWDDEALVYEVVPAERATLRWIWRRNVRLGNVASRVTLRSRPRAVVLALGVTRVIWGVVATAVDIVAKRHVTRDSFSHIPKGVGMVGASVGALVEEYQR